MDLASQLDAFRTGWEARVGDATAAMIAGDLVALRDTGILDRAARAGDRLPPADHLVDALGRPFDLAGLVAAGPVVITFYRGGWCPYCNLELRAWQALLPRLQALGGSLVAISPQTPDGSLSTAEKNALGFDVASDAGSRVGDAYGLTFRMPADLQALYRERGIVLPDVNGDDDWRLPLPATFVIARDGRVALAHVDVDYRVRLEPEDALACVAALPG